MIGEPRIMEHQDTIAGLLAKRRELADLIKDTRASISKIDAAISVLDPSMDPSEIRHLMKPEKAKRGALKKFVMECLRTAETPIRAQSIATAWITDQGIPNTKDNMALMSQRIRACLLWIKKQGLIAEAGDGWIVA